MGQFLPNRRENIGSISKDHIRGQAVRFRHEDIKTYGLGLQPVSRFDELCKPCTRPRPAAQCGKAGVVDIYNHDGKTFDFPGEKPLVGVENKMTQGTPTISSDDEGNG